MESRRLPASRRTTVALIGMGLFCSLALQATTTLPPVTATGTRIGGGSIICRGEGCAGVLFMMQNGSAIPPNEVSATPLEDIPVDGNAFCQNLNQNKPSGCSLSSPPASPGITVPGQTAWAPNGCGTGGIGSWFQDAILEVVTSQSYSGDIHAPYPGVSFRAACDAHDACWASGGFRAECDNAFRDSTQAACSIISSSAGRSTCSGFGSLYHGAVTTTNGSHNAYATSSNNRQCALWASDMRENNCGN